MSSSILHGSGQRSRNSGTGMDKATGEAVVHLFIPKSGPGQSSALPSPSSSSQFGAASDYVAPNPAAAMHSSSRSMRKSVSVQGALSMMSDTPSTALAPEAVNYFSRVNDRKDVDARLRVEVSALKEGMDYCVEALGLGEEALHDIDEEMAGIMRAAKKHDIATVDGSYRARVLADQELQQWAQNVIDKSQGALARHTLNDEEMRLREIETAEDILPRNARAMFEEIIGVPVGRKDPAEDNMSMSGSTSQRVSPAAVRSPEGAERNRFSRQDCGEEAMDHFHKLMDIALTEIKKVTGLESTVQSLKEKLEELQTFATQERLHEMRAILLKKEQEKNAANSRWRRAVASFSRESERFESRLGEVASNELEYKRMVDEHEEHIHKLEGDLQSAKETIAAQQAEYEARLEDMRKRTAEQQEAIQGMTDNSRRGSGKRTAQSVGTNTSEEELGQKCINLFAMQDAFSDTENDPYAPWYGMGGSPNKRGAKSLSPARSSNALVGDRSGSGGGSTVLGMTVGQIFQVFQMRARHVIMHRAKTKIIRWLFRVFKSRSRREIAALKAKIASQNDTHFNVTRSMQRRLDAQALVVSHGEVAAQQLPVLHKRNEELQKQLDHTGDERYQLKKRVADLVAQIKKMQENRIAALHIGAASVIGNTTEKVEKPVRHQIDVNLMSPRRDGALSPTASNRSYSPSAGSPGVGSYPITRPGLAALLNQLMTVVQVATKTWRNALEEMRVVRLHLPQQKNLVDSGFDDNSPKTAGSKYSEISSIEKLFSALTAVLQVGHEDAVKMIPAINNAKTILEEKGCNESDDTIAFVMSCLTHLSTDVNRHLEAVRLSLDLGFGELTTTDLMTSRHLKKVMSTRHITKPPAIATSQSKSSSPSRTRPPPLVPTALSPSHRSQSMRMPRQTGKKGKVLSPKERQVRIAEQPILYPSQSQSSPLARHSSSMSAVSVAETVETSPPQSAGSPTDTHVTEAPGSSVLAHSNKSESDDDGTLSPKAPSQVIAVTARRTPSPIARHPSVVITSEVEAQTTRPNSAISVSAGPSRPASADHRERPTPPPSDDRATQTSPSPSPEPEPPGIDRRFYLLPNNQLSERIKYLAALGLTPADEDIVPTVVNPSSLGNLVKPDDAVAQLHNQNVLALMRGGTAHELNIQDLRVMAKRLDADVHEEGSAFQTARQKKQARANPAPPRPDQYEASGVPTTARGQRPAPLLDLDEGTIFTSLGVVHDSIQANSHVRVAGSAMARAKLGARSYTRPLKPSAPRADKAATASVPKARRPSFSLAKAPPPMV